MLGSPHRPKDLVRRRAPCPCLLAPFREEGAEAWHDSPGFHRADFFLGPKPSQRDEATCPFGDLSRRLSAELAYARGEVARYQPVLARGENEISDHPNDVAVSAAAYNNVIKSD